MRRVLIVWLVLAAVAAVPATAGAHPLGNFSVNHLTQVSISSDRVDVRYILDQAEIPTFQERGVPDARLRQRKQAEVERGLIVTVDGRRADLQPAGPPLLTHPPGQGGLATTRVELPLTARVDGPERVAVRDDTFRERVGWKAIVVRPGRGTAVRSTAPAEDPTDGLRGYPEDLLESPADLRSASFAVTPGPGTVQAPDATRVGEVADRNEDGGFTEVFSDAAAGEGVLILLLLTAFAWGAVHALSPGHGKAMVAAYLVGTRGTARHAVALGGIVTATHTAGVFALGLVALLLSEYILPETLYPWLNLVSGALVLVVGAGVLGSRLRSARGHRHREHDQSHSHDHRHGHAHSHGASKAHSHAPPDRVTWRGLVAMGAAAGLIPCPSALVVLLGAVAQGQIALGMLLIVAFSAGLAATLVALGLAVVLASRALGRVRVPGRLTLVLPTASALLIVGVGLVLTVQALPQVA
jgi:nickel/cobalt exporter